MADNPINLPSGFGGIVRFKEEYSSYFNVKPLHVMVFVVVIVVFRVFLEFLY